MKSVYFILVTLLCLLLLITHGNGDDHDDESDNKQTVQVEPKPSITTKPLSFKDKNTTESLNPLSSLADPATMKRMLYVLLGFTTLVVAFFAFKTIRARTRRKTKKYGVLATPASDVELTPLDQEDEDEDMTVFDANSK